MRLLDLFMLLKEKNCCHTDIKPDNIMLVAPEHSSDVYEIKIIDFGSLT